MSKDPSVITDEQAKIGKLWKIANVRPKKSTVVDQNPHRVGETDPGSIKGSQNIKRKKNL